MTFDGNARLRIGVLGASNVLRVMWHFIDEAGHEVYAVGCRDLARGQAFVDEFYTAKGLTRKPTIGTYDNIVSSSNIDVVYITIPVALRHKWVLECAKYGKHIVVEKPAAESCQQLREWLHALAAKRLLFVDATMLSHGRRVYEVRDAIKSLGQLRRMEAYFSYSHTESLTANDIRLDPSLEPLGALGDLGWHCVRYFLHMVDFALPTKVMGRVAQTGGPKDGITAFSGDLVFGTGPASVTASFVSSFHSAHEQLVRIKCDDGIVTVHDAMDPSAAAFTVERNAFESPAAARGAVAFRRSAETRRGAEGRGAPSVGLWRDAEAALVRGDPAEPAAVVPERSAQWARAAWVTQCACDKLLEAARKTVEKQAEVDGAVAKGKNVAGKEGMRGNEKEKRSSESMPVKPQVHSFLQRGGEVEL